MRHVENALIKMMPVQVEGEIPDVDLPHTFISILNKDDIKGVPPVVSFSIQSDPIGEVGVNGCQAVDMLEYVKCLFESLNDAFPCRENALTITKIEEALHWQEHRTKDRQKRLVEGKNEA
jgi:hypothetical protein